MRGDLTYEGTDEPRIYDGGPVALAGHGRAWGWAFLLLTAFTTGFLVGLRF